MHISYKYCLLRDSCLPCNWQMCASLSTTLGGKHWLPCCVKRESDALGKTETCLALRSVSSTCGLALILSFVMFLDKISVLGSTTF